MLTSFRLLNEDSEEDVGLVLESAVLVNAFSVHRLLVVGGKGEYTYGKDFEVGALCNLHFTPRLN